MKKFEFCDELTLKNNKFYYTKSKIEFSLLKDNNEEKCKFLLILYDNISFDY